MTVFTLSRRTERFVLVLLAVASALATAVVIGDAAGDSDVRLAVLAAARGRALQSRAVLVAALGARDRARAAAVTAAAAASVGADGGGAADSGGSSAADSSSASAASGPAASTGADSPAGAPAGTSAPSSTTSRTPTAATPVATVSHLFEIVITGAGYQASFGRGSSMPYLRSLLGRGTLLSGYHSLGDGPLADELALVSGQTPNADTTSGCPNYSEFPIGTTVSAAGLARGAGCVYPETVLTLGDQISSAGHQWRAYVDGMGTRSCQHANSNSLDASVLPGSQPSYDTRANPFIYFHSLLDLGDCANDDLDLSHFRAGTGHSAPIYTYIAPSLCAEPAPLTPSASGATTTTSSAAPVTDPAATTTATQSGATTSTTTMGGSSVTAGPAANPACPAGRPTGSTAQDTFLKAWVPKVLTSAAYRDKGALVIAFTAAAGAGHPVRTGALLLASNSPHPRTLTARSDPYTLLRATETALGLGLLGDAKHAAAVDVFPSAHPSERTRSAGN